MNEIKIDGQSLFMRDLETFLRGDVRVSPTREARQRVAVSSEFCQRLSVEEEAHYGINTGFGMLAGKRIDRESLGTLQKNLLRSHATGLGEALPKDIVRLMMLLRANSLLRGYSGISMEAIEYLCEFLNSGATPVVPAYGSVGASGDLAPLAHMSLPLIGEGVVDYEGERLDGAEALRRLDLSPLDLKPKEGLALINGTQLMASYAVRELLRSIRCLKGAMIAAAMSIEAFEATDRIFDPRIHRLKNHPGEIKVAAGFRRILEGSDIVASHRDCSKVQDPYSFRCVPQVLGAVVDTMGWVQEWVEREINAVTDNPIVFADDGDIVSGGNFHGEHMALALDGLAIAMSEVGSIAERRIDKLLDNDSDKLPQCLIRNPGLNSGLMVTQYLAAALVSENKLYSHPASVDSIPTSAGFEDHVSMGSIAALKLAKVVDNVARVEAVELLCAAQAMDYFKPLTGGKGSSAAHSFIRRDIPFIERDTVMNEYLTVLESMVLEGTLVGEVEGVVGDLLAGT